MTNYNERLDEILERLYRIAADTELAADRCDPYAFNGVSETKQLITSLIKELVAEAKPEYVSKTSRLYFQANSNGAKAHMNGYRLGIREYEQNLLKALEEVWH